MLAQPAIRFERATIVLVHVLVLVLDLRPPIAITRTRTMWLRRQPCLEHRLIFLEQGRAPVHIRRVSRASLRDSSVPYRLQIAANAHPPRMSWNSNNKN